jgi:hypothetical protein
MPPNTVSVCRPGKFGNPFKEDACRDVGYTGTDEQIKNQCIEAFKFWLVDKNWRLSWEGKESEKRREAILDSLHLLKGKNLACWCREGTPCHADVLIDLANK